MVSMTQAEALTILKTGANVFLTGEPGAGKSHTVNEFTHWLREHGVEPAITASTGIAATHIGGLTIHSWAGIGIKRTLSQYDLDRIASTEHVVKRMRRTKILIIDEVSMLSPDTLAMLDAVCREVFASAKAFGGLQVVFVGDFFQLPPIIARDATPEVDADGMFQVGAEVPRFAYSSAAWKRANPIVCYLTEQHRQESGAFLGVLSAIRRNQFGQSHMEHIESRKIERGKAPARRTQALLTQRRCRQNKRRHALAPRGLAKKFCDGRARRACNCCRAQKKLPLARGAVFKTQRFGHVYQKQSQRGFCKRHARRRLPVLARTTIIPSLKRARVALLRWSQWSGASRREAWCAGALASCPCALRGLLRCTKAKACRSTRP